MRELTANEIAEVSGAGVYEFLGGLAISAAAIATVAISAPFAVTAGVALLVADVAGAGMMAVSFC